MDAEKLNALLVYGTRWSGTVKVAETIGKALSDEGISVEVVDAKKSPTKHRRLRLSHRWQRHESR